jgi:hypothetical protein
MKYAMINAANQCEYTRDFATQPDDPTGKPGRRWVSVEIIAATPGPDQIRDGDAGALEDGVWVIRQQVRDLTSAELEDRRVSQLRTSDGTDMARMVEDIMVVIATGGASALTRDSFPAAVWGKINARRALRGEASV